MKISFFIIRILVVAIVIFTLHENVSSQKGYPYVSPFSLDEAIDNDNFDIIQDNNQNILIANRKGILTFDSRNWDLLPLPYFPVVLTKSRIDGTIYAGCRNGFGYLHQEITGKYNYNSLSDTLFTGEISDIGLTINHEYFVSRNRIYYTSDNKEKIAFWEFPYENKITGSFVFKDNFYFMVYQKGLFKAETETDTFSLFLNDRFSTQDELIFATDADSNEIIVGTADNKLFLFSGSSFSSVFIQDAEYLNASVITDGVVLGDNKIAIGSLMGGVLISDYKTGVTSTILNFKTGLPDDEIYCLGTDNNSGLWLCHSFGVSRIDNRLSVANLTWYPGLNGNLTNTAFFNDQLYVGSSDGLYILQEKREYREKIIPEKPQVSKTTGKTQVKENIQTPSESVTGRTGVINPAPAEPLSKRDQRKKRREEKTQTSADSKTESTKQVSLLDKIFSTVENPSRIFDRKPDIAELAINKKKVYSLQSISHSYEKVPEVKGKCTEILAIKDHLMVSTYNGLYDIRYKQVTTVLPNTYINFLNKGPGDNLLFAGSGKSLFVLLLKGSSWDVLREFDALNYPVYSACMISPGELWLGSDNSVHKLTLDRGYFVTNDETIPISTKFSDKVILRNIDNQLYFFLFSGIFRMENNIIKPVKSFDNLYSLPGYYFSENDVVWYRSSGRWDFIANSSTGMNLPEEYLNIFPSVQDINMGNSGELYIIVNNEEVYKIYIDPEKIDSEGFSVFFSGLKGSDNQLFPLRKPKISYKKSSLKIEFSAPYYLAPGKTEFSYRILGLNDEWSQWSTVSNIEYPLLPPGEYNIQAKARNIFGKESEESNLEILIKPPFWKTIVFYILITILIFSMFVLIVKIREQNLRKAKRVLEQKVKERTAEIERQKNEISEQKKEITDSIFYARRIQAAVLPSTSMLNSVLPEHFVLFLPKDIVSGDFYWLTVKGEKIVILAADCTGHGVPGAFMSMLGVSFLNEIVSAHELDDAGSILNSLRDHVKSTLAKSGDSVHARDGMDIALCIIDQKQMKLQYAGAYNPLYMIRSGELTEIKADKMPIGWYDIDAAFTNNVVKFKKGDCFYICSDGYVDQFGGTFGKKFLSKPFKELLLKNHSQPMSMQKELLLSNFENWKGSLHQVDDVLVIGFRI